MWNYIKEMLSSLLGHKKDNAPISNTLTFNWVFTIILSFMLRLHKGGVSSLQRALGIDPSHYCSMDDVFRSGAIDLHSMRNSWIDVITTEMTPYEVDGRLVFTGDGVLQPKEGRRQPGVTRHHKDSGTQTKPSSFHGIHAGCINILTKTNNGNLCATPLTAELMDGLAPTANWKNSKKPHANRSLELQEITRASEITNRLQHYGIYLTDRASMCRDCFRELDALNAASEYKLSMIVPVKKDCRAYEKPVIDPHKRGRHPLKGDDFKVMDWAKNPEGQINAEIFAYGKIHNAKYKTGCFLWGKGYYRELRFVAVDLCDGRGVFVLVCTDTDFDPVSIVQLYCYRFLCEEAFKQYKTVFHGLDMHFWSKSHPWNSFVAPKGTAHVLESVEDPEAQEHILKTVDAMERYLQFAIMAQGIAQRIASEQEIGGTIHRFTSKRSKNAVKVSEEDICNYLSAHLSLLLAKYSDDELIQFIRGKQSVEDAETAFNLL